MILLNINVIIKIIILNLIIKIIIHLKSIQFNYYEYKKQ